MSLPGASHSSKNSKMGQKLLAPFPCSRLVLEKSDWNHCQASAKMADTLISGMSNSWITTPNKQPFELLPRMLPFPLESLRRHFTTNQSTLHHWVNARRDLLQVDVSSLVLKRPITPINQELTMPQSCILQPMISELQLFDTLTC